MPGPDVLPICTTREVRGRIQIRGLTMVPVHCMNCGKHYGYCPEPEPGSGYVGYLCEPCAEKWSPIVGVSLTPDEAFWQRAREAQLEDYGRELTVDEQTRELGDVSSPLSLLARSR
ncbi:MAG TPA: hypothetical protein VFT22_07285 [Kofleriaceae bacterium]|nr:hypothetical protein [Kofleriaceae bacterium]